MDTTDGIDEIRKVADAGEIYTLMFETTTIKLTDGKAKNAERKQESGMAVRLMENGREGFSSALGPADLKEVIGRARASARFGEKAEFHFVKDTPQAEPVTYSDTVEALTIDRMRRMGEEVCARIKEECPDGTVEVSVSKATAEHTISNTEGADITERFSHFYLYGHLEWVRGEEILSIYAFEVSVAAEDFTDKVVSDILRYLRWSEREAKVDSGEKDVLFAAKGGASMVLLPLMVALNGENIARRISPLLGKVDEKLFSDMLTVVDDGTIDLRTGSSTFDCEGVAVRRNILVENGVVKNFIFDLKHGAMAGAESTGNGKRSLTSLPRPSFNNFIVQPGNTPLDEMIRSVKDGVFVASALGVGQGNIISGAFSNPLGLAFRIENGEVVGKIRKAAVAGNIYEAFKRIKAVSKETEVGGSSETPYLLLGEVSVVSG